MFDNLIKQLSSEFKIKMLTEFNPDENSFVSIFSVGKRQLIGFIFFQETTGESFIKNNLKFKYCYDIT